MRTCLFISMALLAGGLRTAGQTNEGWRYTLLDASTIADDCPICGRPTIAYPLRGTFDLVLVGTGPLFTEYRMTNISFYALSKEQPLYTVSGTGTYRLGGQFAIQQDIVLQTEVCNLAPSCRDVTFTNDDRVPSVTFPSIDVSVTQTQASSFSVYLMRIVAAPVREIWFSVTNSFTATNNDAGVRAGDLLSHTGRIVRTNTALFEAVGITNPSPTLRVDAFDIVPGGEVFFSLSESALSATLGLLFEGDLLSNRGRIVQRNQQLTARFGIQPIVPDVGLDAISVQANGEVLFSIRTNIFAEGKGFALRHGDVLSNTGTVFKASEELLARFNPPPTIAPMDYGLDALYVWPNGEIWFSVQTGFDDGLLGPIHDDDLLSTEGLIVFRNADLVSRFRAPPNPSGFGLSGLFVVSDSAVAPPPRFLPLRNETGPLTLQWIGTNRVFQLEQANDVTGPWQVIRDVDPDSRFIETTPSRARSFYRVRGW